MILTLYANALASKLQAPKGSAGALSLTDLPAFCRNELGLNGIALTTKLLVGVDRAMLQAIVQAGDRAGCPCLALVESDPQPLGDIDLAGAAADRVQRVVQAAHWLGCSAVGIPVESSDNEDALLTAAEALRPVLRKVEKMEMNLCITSGKGLTSTPERVAELLKKVGGFRIGTFPDYESASQQPDPTVYLRKLVPYASTVLAATLKFEGTGKAIKHVPYDLAEYTKTLATVGYDGPLAIDYRGSGDPVAGLIKARDLIRTITGSPDDDD